MNATLSCREQLEVLLPPVEGIGYAGQLFPMVRDIVVIKRQAAGSADNHRLDKGEGKKLDLEELPRERLDKERIT